MLVFFPFRCIFFFCASGKFRTSCDNFFVPFPGCFSAEPPCQNLANHVLFSKWIAAQRFYKSRGGPVLPGSLTLHVNTRPFLLVPTRFVRQVLLLSLDLSHSKDWPWCRYHSPVPTFLCEFFRLRETPYFLCEKTPFVVPDLAFKGSSFSPLPNSFFLFSSPLSF